MHGHCYSGVSGHIGKYNSRDCSNDVWVVERADSWLVLSSLTISITYIQIQNYVLLLDSKFGTSEAAVDR